MYRVARYWLFLLPCRTFKFVQCAVRPLLSAGERNSFCCKNDASVKGQGGWVRRPHSPVVCLISLIDVARRGVRPFVCAIALPRSLSRHNVAGAVNSLGNRTQGLGLSRIFFKNCQTLKMHKIRPH